MRACYMLTYMVRQKEMERTISFCFFIGKNCHKKVFVKIQNFFLDVDDDEDHWPLRMNCRSVGLSKKNDFAEE